MPVTSVTRGRIIYMKNPGFVPEYGVLVSCPILPHFSNSQQADNFMGEGTLIRGGIG